MGTFDRKSGRLSLATVASLLRLAAAAEKYIVVGARAWKWPSSNTNIHMNLDLDLDLN